VKILAVSDKVIDNVHSPTICEEFGDVDLVIACGDLPFHYLEYIASSLGVPCFLVYGNHDLNIQGTPSGQITRSPSGWTDLDERSVQVNGLLLAGLEGSLRYNSEGVHQYSQDEMRGKALRLMPRLLINRLRYGRFLDVLVSHAPPYGIHDGPDYAHLGFTVFLTIIDRLRPRYVLHGHQHAYGAEKTLTCRHDTQIINVYPARVIDIDPP
jgi:Icc-related predicted phosphoesterase